jgi:SAM-dependent methyltransferase
MMMTDSMHKYFSGELLYGDDFTIEQIAEWYAQEEEGYANLGNTSDHNKPYEYHELNKCYGFDRVTLDANNLSALGLGSSFGHEFLPILHHLAQITIIEPSEQLRSEQISHIKPVYVKPAVSGALPFADHTFDLITCFGTLHHIPNVSFIVTELRRVTKPGGLIFIREPISTMGDWRRERPGLTKNERGIPASFFDALFNTNQLQVISKSFCSTGFLNKLVAHGLNIGRTRAFYRLDRVVSRLLSGNLVYHRQKLSDKLAPGSVFYILKK